MTAPRGMLLAGVFAGALGCCAHRAVGPGATVATFGNALARGDLAAAYALTSADFRRRMPFEAFAAEFRAGGREPAALGQRMAAEAPAIAPRVDLELSLGEQVPLVLEGGQWRIDGPVFEAWGQGTARAALRTFVRALEARRYDIVLRLVPSRYRAGLTAERLRVYWEGDDAKDHAAMLAELRAALVAPISETGDEARFSYPPGREARLVREAGQWKIEDPDQNHVVTTSEH
ncbi:MAG TPA: hypothetical protein VFG23_04285 [Polyangia bacterium]|nr:hypothetical protein [Polyangia bacterium]